MLDSLWDSFEPDTDRVVGNAHLLFSIKKPNGLPYHHSTEGTKYFFVTSLPDSLKPQEKHGANDNLTCHFCREEVKLSKMWNHVGGHIMCNLCGAENAKLKPIGSAKRELLHKNKMNCNRLEKILVDSVA